MQGSQTSLRAVRRSIKFRTLIMSAKRARKPLAGLALRVNAPRKKQKEAPAIKLQVTTLPPETFIPLDPALEYDAEARFLEVDPTPTAFFELFWDDTIFHQITKAKNSHALSNHASGFGSKDYSAV